MKKKSLAAWGALLVVLAAPRPATAHRLGADWFLRNGRLEVESFFENDSAPQGAKVCLLNAAQEPIAQTTTDAKGLAYFALPAPGPYRIVVDAGAGHRKTLEIMVPDPSTGEPPPAAPPVSRPEFIQVPWLKAGLGLGIIGLVAAAAVIGLRRSGRRDLTSNS